MATFRKRGNKWRAEISKNGIRKSATFTTKTEVRVYLNGRISSLD